MKARKVSEELFSSKGVSDNMPSITISRDYLNINIVDLLIKTNLASSKSEARRLILQNGISLNQKKVESSDRIVTADDLRDNALILQKGKKIFLRVCFE